MKLADLYLQAHRLTPRAAKFAEKLLQGSPQIAYEVRHAMLVALLELTHPARAPTVTEWSSLERPSKSKDARTHSDVTEARIFVNDCARFAADHWTEPT